MRLTIIWFFQTGLNLHTPSSGMLKSAYDQEKPNTEVIFLKKLKNK